MRKFYKILSSLLILVTLFENTSIMVYGAQDGNYTGSLGDSNQDYNIQMAGDGSNDEEGMGEEGGGEEIGEDVDTGSVEIVGSEEGGEVVIPGGDVSDGDVSEEGSGDEATCRFGVSEVSGRECILASKFEIVNDGNFDYGSVSLEYTVDAESDYVECKSKVFTNDKLIFYLPTVHLPEGEVAGYKLKIYVGRQEQYNGVFTVVATEDLTISTSKIFDRTDLVLSNVLTSDENYKDEIRPFEHTEFRFIDKYRGIEVSRLLNTYNYYNLWDIINYEFSGIYINGDSVIDEETGDILAYSHMSMECDNDLTEINEPWEFETYDYSIITVRPVYVAQYYKIIYDTSKYNKEFNENLYIPTQYVLRDSYVSYDTFDLKELTKEITEDLAEAVGYKYKVSEDGEYIDIVEDTSFYISGDIIVEPKIVKYNFADTGSFINAQIRYKTNFPESVKLFTRVNTKEELGYPIVDISEYKDGSIWYNYVKGTWWSIGGKMFLNKDSANMFSNISAVNIDLSHLDTRFVENMSYMFSGNEVLQNIDTSGFNTSNVTNMDHMFFKCFKLKAVDTENWDTSKVKYFGHTFDGCWLINELALSNWDTSSAVDMNNMFCWMKGIKELDLSSFNTSKVTNMSLMFSGSTSLVTIKLNSFDTSNVVDMSRMFESCIALRNLDLSSFDTSNVKDMHQMFDFTRCRGLIIGDKFVPSNYLKLDTLDSTNSTYKMLYVDNNDTIQNNDLLELFKSHSGWCDGEFTGGTFISGDNIKLEFDAGNHGLVTGYHIRYVPRYSLVNDVYSCFPRVRDSGEWHAWGWEANGITDDNELRNTVLTDNTMFTMRWSRPGYMIDGYSFNTLIPKDERYTKIDVVYRNNVISRFNNNGSNMKYIDITVDKTNDIWLVYDLNYKDDTIYIVIDDRVYIRGVTGFSARLNDSCWKMFYGCDNIVQIDNLNLLSWSVVGNCDSMFSGCVRLRYLNDFSKCLLPGGLNMRYMFYQCKSLEEIELPKFSEGISTVTYTAMFENCINLRKVIFHNTIFRNRCDSMFYNCINLKSIVLNADMCPGPIEPDLTYKYMMFGVDIDSLRSDIDSSIFFDEFTGIWLPDGTYVHK